MRNRETGARITHQVQALPTPYLLQFPLHLLSGLLRGLFAKWRSLLCLSESLLLPVSFDSLLSVGKVILRQMNVAVCCG